MRKVLITLAGLGVLAACMEAEMPQAADGRAIYLENCSVCHGVLGRGDGAMAGDLSKAPADLTTIALRSGGSFPRAAILSTIDGYAKSGRGTHAMPEFGAVLEGDLIPFDSGDGIQTPTPRRLVALVEYLESIQASQ